MKNKQSIIALFLLFVMVFNTCRNPIGIDPEISNPNSFTPMYFYVDSNGDFSETDLGRTGLVADENAYVVFYSDDINSDADRVGFAFEDKIIVFFFEKNHYFPISMLLSDSEESYNGFFTPYDFDTQTYGLKLEQGDDEEIWPNIYLNIDTFTHYIDDPELTPSQNLRMRNLYIAMCIYLSLDDNISASGALQARFLGKLFKGIGKFFVGAVTVVVVGIALFQVMVTQFPLVY